MEEKVVTEVKDEAKAGAAVSRSKQKRQERDKKNKSAKVNKKLSDILWPVVGVVIVAAIIALIAAKVVSSANQVVASDNFGAEMDDNGFIKGVKATDYITLPDYRNLKVPAAEVAYTDEEMQADIDSALENHKQLDRETTTPIADGDTVNIDYIGSIDGVEFEGGNSNGEGYDLTIGSGSFIDDFEQQLIGYRAGEVVNVNVDFPEDYGSPELAGKNADFVVTINGILVKPEFTDLFVSECLTAYATTVDEYKQYLKENAEEDKLIAYLSSYITDNAVVKKYPKKFLKNLKNTTRYSDEESYQYMNQMYMQYYGSGFSSFEEYYGMSEEEYLADLDTRAKEDCKAALANQAILEQEGITISADEVKASLLETYGSEESYESMLEQYGMGYLTNNMIPDKVLEILKNYAVVE